MIVKGSRYQGVSVTGIRSTDGVDRKFLHDRRIFTMADVGDNFTTHEVKGEETLESIAYDRYKNESLWFLIGDVNNIFFMFDLVPGQVLVIPDASIRVKVTK